MIEESKITGLVGRCFHIFGEDGHVQYQGQIRCDLGGGNYLVQYFDWLIGEPGTMSIVPVSKMIERELRRGNGSWQFYEDVEHMNFWYEHKAKR